MPENHARLSPSSADRWMRCPGSVILSEGLPEVGNSDFANEGTAAHFLACECLTNKRHPAEFLGRTITVTPDGAYWGSNSGDPSIPEFQVDVEMAANVNHYVQAVLSYAKGGVLMVEQEVPIGHLTGEEGAVGTADAIIVTPDGELQIHDLKYGQGKKVEPENNRQLQLYALGADEAYNFAFNYDRVRLVIHQVRVSPTPQEWNLSLEDLRLFAEQVRTCADKVHRIDLGEMQPHEQLFASEEACAWCRAKPNCPELLRVTQMAVAAEFEGIDPVMLPDSPADLGACLDAVPLVEMWCKAIRAAAERDLLAGKPVTGYKLVQGKKGNRKWADPERVEELLKSMRLKKEEMYDYKLISPTTAETLVKAGTIGKRQWAKLQGLITQSPGAPTVVPESDPRPAISVHTDSTDFDGLEDLI